MTNNSLILFTLSILFNCSQTLADNKNFWKTPCTSPAIKKEFEINDPEPFEFKNGNCNSFTIDGEDYFKIINEGKKYEFYFLDKINPKCVRFGNHDADKAVCINDELGIYEIEYKGDKESIVKKLTEKYGAIKKKTTNTWYSNAVINYYLFTNTDVSFVVLKESVDSFNHSSFNVAFINSSAYKKWNSEYWKKVSDETKAELDKKNEDTKKGIDKLK